MIRAILIDDELLALLQLENMLKELTDVDIIATYTEPDKAVQHASQWEPDVIFLDIHMPEMNGMQAAEIMQNVFPRADIVFVTAYDEYAIEAFELNALDYILKPVQPSRLKKTIQRLEERLSSLPEKAAQVDKTVIRCFQSLRFERGGYPLQTFRWRTAKAQELFAYLLHYRKRFVSKDKLIDEMWPNFELKKASTHLYTTIYQVRRCLKLADIEIHISNVSGEEGYMLNPGNVVIDTEEWERGIRDLGPVIRENCTEYQRLFDLYTGDYLGDYDYIWAEGERQRLRSIWLYNALQLAEFYHRDGRSVEAVTVYQRIIQIHPYCEEGYWGLMQVYDQMGERSAVEQQFRIIGDLLKNELGIGLSERITSWYKHWKQNQRGI